MSTRDIIVIGASAGGIPALKRIVGKLPEDFPGSIFVVQHIPAATRSNLPAILSQAGPLEAIHPRDGTTIRPGRIYVAPSDHHLLLEDGRVLVKQGPKENRFRPSIDALFRSAAYVYRQRVVGVILSGLMNDGASGLWTIKHHGGLALVQHPDDAEQPQLPLNVLEHVSPDHQVGAEDIGPLLAGLIREPAPEGVSSDQDELQRLETEVTIAARDSAFELGIMDLGELTPLTCPECNGVLVRLAEGELLRYRCHTGHAYTASSLLAEVAESVERMLYSSMRGMEEMHLLLESIAGFYQRMGKAGTAECFRARAHDGIEQARDIHRSIFRHGRYSEDLRFRLDGPPS